MADRLKDLEEIGFRKVGAWKLESGKPVFALDSDEPAHSALYAYVSGREVLYLGKTTQPLRRRMYGYQRPGPTQRTNIAVRARISQLLAQQQALDIYAFLDNGATRIGAFEVNLAAGLEDALLRALQPPWNTQGK